MKTITVSGVVLPVMYAGVSPFIDRFKTQIYFNSMRLGEIVNLLDGNSGIVYDDGETKTEFNGYSRLIEIRYVDDVTVVAFLEKKESNNGTVSE